MTADVILSDLAIKLQTQIPYIGKAYGRAMIFREVWGDHGLVTVPKARIDGEYTITLPHDTTNSQTYFIANGHEKFDEFDRVQIGEINRSFALTFWGNLETIGQSLDDCKFDCIRVLQKSPYVSSIDDYADETYRQVFPEFTDWLTSGSQYKDTSNKEADTQWLMFPWAGFRLEFTIKYVQPC